MLAFFGFGNSSSNDDETPAPQTPSMLDALLGTPTKPADEIDTLAALHTKFRDDLASAPLDDLRKAANEAASLSANDRAAGGWRLDAAARLREEPETTVRDDSETYGGFSPFSPPREAWRAYASPLNDSPGALRRDSPSSKTRVTQVDGKRWGELRVFPGDDAQTPSRWRVANADADGFDEVRDSASVSHVFRTSSSRRWRQRDAMPP